MLCYLNVKTINQKKLLKRRLLFGRAGRFNSFVNERLEVGHKLKHWDLAGWCLKFLGNISFNFVSTKSIVDSDCFQISLFYKKQKKIGIEEKDELSYSLGPCELEIRNVSRVTVL